MAKALSSDQKFSAQIAAWVNKVHKTQHDFARELMLTIMVRIDERSPIGNPKFWKHPAPPGYKPGLFRGSWMLGVDTIDTKQPRTKDASRARGRGMLAVARGMKRIPKDAGGHVYYYTNSVPYAIRLEYGWSTWQAPYGIVGLTATEFKDAVIAALSKVKSDVPG
jgi:hypothetical protein